MDGNNLGNSIKTLRMAKGITQEELAYKNKRFKGHGFRL